LNDRYYVCQGRLEVDKGIDRGEMLVRSEEEWRARFLGFFKRVLWTKIIPLIIIGVFLITFSTVMYSGVFAVRIDLFVYALVAGVGLTMTLATPATAWYVVRSVLRGPVPGLYERGLQQWDRAFIPYEEIASTELKVVGREDVVVMYPKHERVELDGKWRSEPWTVLVEFVGKDGAEELVNRVAAVGNDPTLKVPLVLYGPDGGVRS
jgi:hypothetical protein